MRTYGVVTYGMRYSPKRHFQEVSAPCAAAQAAPSCVTLAIFCTICTVSARLALFGSRAGASTQSGESKKPMTCSGRRAVEATRSDMPSRCTMAPRAPADPPPKMTVWPLEAPRPRLATKFAKTASTTRWPRKCMPSESGDAATSPMNASLVQYGTKITCAPATAECASSKMPPIVTCGERPSLVLRQASRAAQDAASQHQPPPWR
mmetsp:Transcript_7952/g.27810  ORF Transcript_7952/g.27810 Transcript_7952/m.27810 type:complete len:206 (+) Transcript_7952:656-1273(+)